MVWWHIPILIFVWVVLVSISGATSAYRDDKGEFFVKFMLSCCLLLLLYIAYKVTF